jgi:SAM-dependent methyltransferase
MSESLSGWLALREAADAAARSVALTQALADRLTRDRPLRILDLGSGTGSNVRYLARYLPRDQDWLLVDADAALLADARAQMSSWAVRSGAHLHIETQQLNLGELDRLEIFSGRDLVTASALLDLVSDTWLVALAKQCRAAGAIALFSLTYNGHSSCTPAEPEDEAIRLLMNRHQQANDKGFGRAAGPGAVASAERAFAAAGYRVERAASDWMLSPDAPELQRALVSGWAEAAREIAPEQTTMIEDWLDRRLAHVEAGRSRIVVGHEDLAVWRSHPAAGSAGL